jgi:hypothetical protein
VRFFAISLSSLLLSPSLLVDEQAGPKLILDQHSSKDFGKVVEFEATPGLHFGIAAHASRSRHARHRSRAARDAARHSGEIDVP